MNEMATGAGSRPRTVRRSMGMSGTGGLKIYKPGQGYFTRVGTAIGGGVLVVAGSVFLFNELGAYVDPGASYALPLKYGVAVSWILALGVLLYWVVGLNRSANDFFIATEGEMKKVSWSSRREVVRSTKVVIVSVILLGAFLFAADLAFMLFFSTLKVLKAGPGLERLFGSGS